VGTQNPNGWRLSLVNINLHVWLLAYLSNSTVIHHVFIICLAQAHARDDRTDASTDEGTELAQFCTSILKNIKTAVVFNQGIIINATYPSQSI